MPNNISKLLLVGALGTTLSLPAFGDGHSYGPFPITLKGYSGDKTNSVSYSGQIARHVLHDSLKKLSGTTANTNIKQLTLDKMMPYFSGSKEDLTILAPVSKGDFKIKLCF